MKPIKNLIFRILKKKKLMVVFSIADKIGVDVTTKVNPDYIRSRDNKVIIGSHNKIQKELGWKPEIGLSDTIQDMINWEEK